MFSATLFRRAAAATAASLLVAGFALVGAGPAAASDGSIPVQVTNYLGSSLRARLVDLYGPGLGGQGIAFDSTTTFTSTSRVFEFTPDFARQAHTLSSANPGTPIRRVNEWMTVVSVAKTPVGVATVDYSTTNGPTLVTFAPDRVLAAALPKLAATAQLVHDGTHHAWGSLVGETITPIEAGSTGLTAPASLASYPVPHKADAAKPAAQGIEPGVAAGAISLILVVVIIALLVLWPRRKRAL